MILVRVLSSAAALSLLAGSTLAQPRVGETGPVDAVHAPASPAPQVVAGRITDVTVYRGQAMVTRVIGVDGSGPGGGARGLREVVVTDLPEALLPGSLFAEGDDGAMVRSVRYRVRPVAQDAREQVRELEGKVRAKQDEIDAVNALKAVDDAHRAQLDKMELFVAPTATSELKAGVLNAETLQKLVQFNHDQRGELAEREVERAIKLRTLGEELVLLQRELGTLTAGTSRSVREAVVFVDLSGASGSFKLKYLVDNATWAPSYNLRGDTAKNQVGLEYQASVRQLSGEDWGDVKMTLSTATPALLASGPRLEPMVLSLSSDRGEKVRDLSSRSYAEVREELARKQEQFVNGRNLAFAQAEAGPGGTVGWDDERQVRLVKDNDQALNRNAADAQLLDLLTSERVDKRVAGAGAAPAPKGESVSVTYVLTQRTSLPSRSDQQLIQIARAQLPATFARVATPLLSEYVYTEATITNSRDGLVLLAGPASVYVGDQFVGRGSVPTVTTGESFTAGLGVDPSLRARRELVERTESIQGGNRVIDFTYRLTVENFDERPLPVRLMDRMPTSQGSDIRITLTSPGQTLSTDEQYVKNEKKHGLLRWDVSAPALSAGARAFTIDYTFRVEHDKQMSVSESGGLAGAGN